MKGSKLIKFLLVVTEKIFFFSSYFSSKKIKDSIVESYLHSYQVV